MVIFYSYVKLPEGNGYNIQKSWLLQDALDLSATRFLSAGLRDPEPLKVAMDDGGWPWGSALKLPI